MPEVLNASPRITRNTGNVRSQVAVGAIEPSVRFDHSAALWKDDTMVVFGGRFKGIFGDVWLLNLTGLLFC